MIRRAFPSHRAYSTAQTLTKQFSFDELSQFNPKDLIFRWKNNETLIARSQVPAQSAAYQPRR